MPPVSDRVPPATGVDWLTPDWQVVSRVRAAFSLRVGGVSQGAYASLNVGLHVGDEAAHVKENRRRLSAALRLPAEPRWLQQVHGTQVLHLPASSGAAGEPPVADAALTCERRVVLAIQVADCLPVLLAAEDGRCIAAAHAGWRGLAAGVLERTLAAMQTADPQVRLPQLRAWLGPCIGPQEFEVGEEVRQAFLAAGDSPRAFERNAGGRWQADLAMLARDRLHRQGLRHITGGSWCTARASGQFFSHRRESRQSMPSGRMVALLWLEDDVRL